MTTFKIYSTIWFSWWHFCFVLFFLFMGVQSGQEAPWSAGSACAHLRSAGSRPCRLPNCCGGFAHRGARRVRRWPVLRARRRGTRPPASSWAWAFLRVGDGVDADWVGGGSLFGADGARLSGRTDEELLQLMIGSRCPLRRPALRLIPPLLSPYLRSGGRWGGGEGIGPHAPCARPSWFSRLSQVTSRLQFGCSTHINISFFFFSPLHSFPICLHLSLRFVSKRRKKRGLICKLQKHHLPSWRVYDPGAAPQNKWVYVLPRRLFKWFLEVDAPNPTLSAVTWCCANNPSVLEASISCEDYTISELT